MIKLAGRIGVSVGLAGTIIDWVDAGTNIMTVIAVVGAVCSGGIGGALVELGVAGIKAKIKSLGKRRAVIW